MRYNLSLALATAASSVLMSCPAEAQEDVNAARCFLVANLFAGQGAEKDKPVAVQASLFYLGRLTGSAAQVQAQLEDQARTITTSNNAAIMQACVAELTERSNQLKEIGERMRAATAR